jgi:probable F420-dependent oxidoreductase
MAEVTKRVEFGALVSCIGYRNPALLSQMAKTVDHMSDGRLILGLGAGWAERDYREYGYTFGTAGERLRALRDGLAIIKERWATDAPPPRREPLPILIGGSGEQVTLRLAAQYAQLWNGGDGTPEEFRRKNQVLDQRCREIGRDPGTIERVARVDLPATPDQFDAFRDAGAQHLILRLGHPWDLSAVERLVSWRDRHGAS